MKESIGIDKCSCMTDWVLKNIPEGRVIIELGSGHGTTRLLGEKYELYSIEHDSNWCGMYNSTYIYAPIKNKFYDLDVLREALPEKYDVIIIDGPPSKINGKRNERMGFYDNLDMFDTNATMVFDDLHRKRDKLLLDNVCKKLDRDAEIYSCSCSKKGTKAGRKKFGVLKK